jgi:hypothetical protein
MPKSIHVAGMLHPLRVWFLAFAAFFDVLASAANDMPLFDAHIHYSADARTTYTTDDVFKIFDRAGIDRALVSSTPNEGTLALYQRNPRRIVPELRPYRTRADKESWFLDPSIIEFMEQEIKSGIYRAIGEFHLSSGQADTPVVRRIVALAIERDIPLHAHSDDGAIRELFAINPKVKILWAHAGMTASAEVIGAMLERYPTLWVELSLRNSDIAPDGRLDPAWRAAFLRYPGRFVIGTDTWVTPRWETVEAESRAARAWLAQLPREVAEQIAYRNGARMFPANTATGSR